MEYAKKTRNSKGEKLLKSQKLFKSGKSKSEKLAKSKKLSKSGNSLKFSITETGPSFLTSNNKTAFNRL